jgi:hypothetical protein
LSQDPQFLDRMIMRRQSLLSEIIQRPGKCQNDEPV